MSLQRSYQNTTHYVLYKEKGCSAEDKVLPKIRITQKKILYKFIPIFFIILLFCKPSTLEFQSGYPRLSYSFLLHNSGFFLKIIALFYLSFHSNHLALAGCGIPVANWYATDDFKVPIRRANPGFGKMGDCL